MSSAVFREVARYQAARASTVAEHGVDHARRLMAVLRRGDPGALALTEQEMIAVDESIPPVSPTMTLRRRQAQLQRALRAARSAKVLAGLDALPSAVRARRRWVQYLSLPDEWAWRAAGLVWPADGVDYSVCAYTTATGGGWVLTSVREVAGGGMEIRAEAAGEDAAQRSHDWQAHETWTDPMQGGSAPATARPPGRPLQ